MLEGLEITEVSSNKVFSQTVTLRLDPDYFWKQYLIDENVISSRASDFCSMASFGVTVDASAFYPSLEPYYGQGNLPFLRVADVNSVIDYEGCTTIPDEVCKSMPTLAVAKPGDILFTKGGSIARIGILDRPAAVSRDLIFLNTSKLHRQDQTFLYIFFQTPFFNRSLIRSSSQTAQPHLTITLVRDLLSLKASEHFKKILLNTVDEMFALLASSAACKNTAESTLLSALRLDNWAPPTPLSYERSSSDAFTSGRLDSQFFAPRVSELMDRLGQDGLTIGDVAPARHERFKSSDSGSFNYIEIGGLGSDGTAVAETIPQKEAPSRATQFVRAGDIITSTVRPIRRLSALIAEDQDGDVCSSGFVVLTPQKIGSEVLLTYLRLPLFCELMDLHTSATMYPAISEADLLSLPIPAIDSKTQLAIQQSVQEAAANRQRASNLLEAAKRAVEIAIEDSETAALAYLQGVV